MISDTEVNIVVDGLAPFGVLPEHARAVLGAIDAYRAKHSPPVACMWEDALPLRLVGLQDAPKSGTKLYTHPAPMITSVPFEAGWTVSHVPPWDALTDEANREFAWSVERLAAPFCGADGLRVWHGPTLTVAMERARASLAQREQKYD
jgi:hypothetical protein